MRIIKKQFIKFLILTFLFLALSSYPAAGVDELFLSGVVKDIDYKSGLITVDVKSEGCRGLMKFRVDDISKFRSDLVGKDISFSIDSSTCKGDRIFKIKRPILPEVEK